MSQTAQKPATGLTHARIHAILASRDVTRSRDFYVNTLGLKQVAFHEGRDVRLEGGDGTVLYLYQRPAVRPTDATVAGFIVEDVEETVTNLRSRGVQFEDYDFAEIQTDHGIAKVGDTHAAWFKDPDGHILSVSDL